MEDKWIAFKTGRGFTFGCLGMLCTWIGFVLGWLFPPTGSLAQIVILLLLGTLIGLPAIKCAFNVDRKRSAELSAQRKPSS